MQNNSNNQSSLSPQNPISYGSIIKDNNATIKKEENDDFDNNNLQDNIEIKQEHSQSLHENNLAGNLNHEEPQEILEFDNDDPNNLDSNKKPDKTITIIRNKKNLSRKISRVKPTVPNDEFEKMSEQVSQPENDMIQNSQPEEDDKSVSSVEEEEADD